MNMKSILTMRVCLKLQFLVLACSSLREMGYDVVTLGMKCCCCLLLLFLSLPFSSSLVLQLPLHSHSHSLFLFSLIEDCVNGREGSQGAALMLFLADGRDVVVEGSHTSSTVLCIRFADSED